MLVCSQLTRKETIALVQCLGAHGSKAVTFLRRHRQLVSKLLTTQPAPMLSWHLVGFMNLSTVFSFECFS